MKRYLLDTNICVFLLRGKQELRKKILRVGWNNCCISEMTVAELYYGAECSDNVYRNSALVTDFISTLEIVPVNVCIREYCRQKAKLRKLGTPIDDIDLFIGSTAVAMKYTMVTDNLKHFQRIEELKLENWIQR